MRRTFKYRIYGNKQTIANAENWLELCRQLYNVALEERITAWKQCRTTLSRYHQQNEIPEIRRLFPEYKDVGAQCLQNVIIRLDTTYQMFFKRIKTNKGSGFPRFKGKDRYDSFTLTQNNWKLEGKYLSIRNVGRFKLKLSRPIQGQIKTITIRRDSDRWYSCFSCDNVPEKRLPESDNAIGIDVGIKSFLVDSEGNQVESPKFFRKSERLLRRRQRKLSRRIKGSQGRKRARLLVAKAHQKVQNQRSDFLHKTANHYVQNYGLIAVEDLAIENMVINRHLSKSISDSSWGIFFDFLQFKAEEAGRVVTKVPRFEPTSKTCSACGAIKQDLTLNDRQWVCQSCGTLHDRDFNAAKNILRVGQTLQARTCADTQSVACESHRRVPTRHGAGINETRVFLPVPGGELKPPKERT